MKALKTMIAMAGLFAAFSSAPARADSEGHVLDKLWKQYEAAEASDLPKNQLDILGQIKKQATDKRLPWDFYDAAIRYQQVGSRINWKDRQSLMDAVNEEFSAFGDPALIFFHSTNGGPTVPADFPEVNKKALKASRNPEFHKRDWAVIGHLHGDSILENLENDYDYVVWNLFARHLESPAEETFRGRYPMEQFVEYENIMRIESSRGGSSEERTRALEEFASKYAGRAVSLLARQELLRERYDSLNSENASSADFKALREDCAAFERDRKASQEKTLAGCCTVAEDLISNMDAKDIEFEIADNVLTARLRNLSSFELDIRSGKNSVHRVTLTNPERSYYRTDTVRYAIPTLDDGIYEVKCSNGKVSEQSTWRKYSISLVTKYDAQGFWAYAADYLTGAPVKGYEKGFRRIERPADGTFSVSLEENGHVRRSESVKLYDFNTGPYTTDTRLQAILLTDRAAFNPDDTVKYKVILYRRDYKLEPVAAGQEMEVVLTDAQRSEIERTKLKTGEFGSAAGSFALPRRDRNGTYTINVIVDGRSVASQGITVDDFVLPTFALSFDRHERVYPGDMVTFSGVLKAYSGHSLAGADISYTVRRWGTTFAEGSLTPDAAGRFKISFQSEPSGYQNYVLEVKVVDGTGETAEFHDNITLTERNPREDKPKRYFFEDLSDEGHIRLRTVAGSVRTWAVVDLYGLDNRLIESRLVSFDPVGSAAEKTFEYEYLKEYPDALTLSVFYFQNATRYSRTVTLRRKDTRYDLPLSFTRFLDTTSPGQSYEFLIKTAAGVECAATIFDKSSETVRSNLWSRVRPAEYPVREPQYNSVSGTNRASGGYIVYRGTGGRMLAKNSAFTAASARYGLESEEPLLLEAVMDRAEPMALGAQAEMVEEEAAVTIREDFSTTIAWEPFLRSDKDGNIAFRFANADKLSTFYVQLFAHDRAMRNTSLRREMLVTLPVKISVLEPMYLYANDRWNVRVTLSSSVDREISGTLKVGDSAVRATVPALAQASFELPVPFDPAAREIVLTAVFTPDAKGDAGDGVRVRIPVLEPWQTITEAHSGVLLHGADRDALIKDLRSRFVNFPGSDAAMKEISILDMVKEAIPEHFNTESENSITLSRALYAATLAKTIGSAGLDDDTLGDVVSRIVECQCSDGGFSWFKGLDSSPIVTAVILDLCGGLRSRGLEIPELLGESLPDAVEYLDASYFSKEARAYWLGGITMQQYLYVRAMFPEVRFAQKTDAKWRKAARNYLVPSSNRGLQGEIFAKARRMKTLQAFIANEDGVALARRFGVRLGAARRLQRSLEADTRSLVQYAVDHREAGIYFPNAVMPWRGLLESELYAHSLICDLLASRGENAIAEGVRLWLMLQKETQQWSDDPATVNALASVLDGSQETLDTRVIAFSGSIRKPFEKVLAAGNGFTIDRAYYLRRDGVRRKIAEGDSLKVGDSVVGIYSIHNDENRSFVHISIPRPACLRPEDQLSSLYRWNAYRNVRFDRTEYWYESYPEESTTIEEYFFVTQSGVFHAGIPEIESLYAPHYRANGTSGPEMVTKTQ